MWCERCDVWCVISFDVFERVSMHVFVFLCNVCGYVWFLIVCSMIWIVILCANVCAHFIFQMALSLPLKQLTSLQVSRFVEHENFIFHFIFQLTHYLTHSITHTHCKWYRGHHTRYTFHYLLSSILSHTHTVLDIEILDNITVLEIEILDNITVLDIEILDNIDMT